MPRQPLQGSADRVLVKNNFDTTSINMAIKVFRSTFTTLMNRLDLPEIVFCFQRYLFDRLTFNNGCI